MAVAGSGSASVAGPEADGTDGPRVVVSVDAMGGDRGPSVVVAGCDRSARKNPRIGFILHGDEAALARMVARRKSLRGRCEIRGTTGVVTMNARPSAVLRGGADTSMWSAIESVRQGEAEVAVSCGNTGALMAVSMVRLRKLEGVDRPAMACLWPSLNRHGFNILLDAGADIRADQDDLLRYALMGSSFARNGFGLSRPRIGLLNVGTERIKGSAELQLADEMIRGSEATGNFEYVGFVEGGDIPSSRVDVVVTDGFAGNVAIKTAEGTAALIREFLREAFAATPLSRIASLMAFTSFRRLRKRMDPRRVNGGVFLGLDGTVVKSHGGADATGMSAAIKLAFTLADSGFRERLAARVASVPRPGQDDAADRTGEPQQQ